MKKIKTIIMVLLCILLVLPLSGCFGKKNSGEFVLDREFDYFGQNDDFMYNVYGNYIGIAKYIGQKEDVVVPDTIEGLPVLVIEEGAFLEQNYGEEEEKIKIKTVTLPDKLMIIENSAFEGCELLTTINIPNSITELGYGIFNGCKSLVSITVPPMIEEIPSSYCNGCENLLTIVFSEGTEEYPLSKERTIGQYAFKECKSLQTVNIPKEIVAIESMAFYGCESLRNIVLLNTVQEIGESVFGGTSKELVVYGYRKSVAAQYCSDNLVKFSKIDDTIGINLGE